MRFDDAVRRKLAELEARHLLRTPHVVQGRHGPAITLDGRRVLDFCSNDYLGLAGDPRLAEAARAALDSHGLGAPASRQISGTTDLHRQAEARLAGFVGREAALLFSTGYGANTGAIAALASAETLVLSDELNHASLIDGCRLSRARLVVYRHLDLADLAQRLRAERGKAAEALVITESVFSMEGDLAPLAELRALCDQYDAGLYVDEAHALGVLGPAGAGACVAAGVVPDVLVGTLGKAFGCSGAFVAGRSETVRLLENRSRSHMFSTAAPPLLAAAAIAAADLVAAANDRRAQLAEHAARLRAHLPALGRPSRAGASPIIPVHIGEAERTMQLSAALLDAGFFVHGIRPPTVPAGTSRLRITPMATHTAEDITALLGALSAVLP